MGICECGGLGCRTCIKPESYTFCVKPPGNVPDELLAVFGKARHRLYVQARTNDDYLFIDYCDSILEKYKTLKG